MTLSYMSRSDLEIQMIRSDLEFCISMQKINPSLTFLGLPYMSLIAIESCNYLQIPNQNKYANDIRAKLKFLDDTKTNLLDTVSLFKKIWSDHQEYFKDKNVGDVYYNQHFLGNTLSQHYLISLSKKNTPLLDLSKEKIMALSQSIGELIGLAMRTEKINIENNPPETAQISEELIRLEDHYFNEYNMAHFGGELSPELAQLFMKYLSMLNFSYFVLTPLNTNIFTLYKIRYITLYHVISSIKKLQGYFRKNRLISTNSDTLFQSISSDKDGKAILSSRLLRNVVTHYRIDKSNLELSGNNLLSELAKYYQGAKELESFEESVDSKISEVIDILNSWFILPSPQCT